MNGSIFTYASCVKCQVLRMKFLRNVFLALLFLTILKSSSLNIILSIMLISVSPYYMNGAVYSKFAVICGIA